MIENKKIYEDITVVAKARMVTYEEITSSEIGCTSSEYNSCPRWLYRNLNATGDNNTRGYWTATPYFSNNPGFAWSVGYLGYMFSSNISENNETGIRPVIELSK